jgi:hypothetical protein
MSKAKKQVVHVCLYSHKHGVDVGAISIGRSSVVS